LTGAKRVLNYWEEFMSMETPTRAWEVLQDAYSAQMEGDYDPPSLYSRHWSCIPRRSSYFLAGLHYRALEDVSAECKRAIELDPEFGNP